MIADPEDAKPYRSARAGQFDCRFDVPVAGACSAAVELRFADTQHRGPPQQLDDVVLEGAYGLPGPDISAEVDKHTADNHKFFVKETDGQVHLRFLIRRSFKEPVVNALRVIHRPDM